MAVIKYQNFSFIFIEGKEIGIHPGLHVLKTVQEREKWIMGSGFEWEVNLNVICITVVGYFMFC